MALNWHFVSAGRSLVGAEMASVQRLARWMPPPAIWGVVLQEKLAVGSYESIVSSW